MGFLQVAYLILSMIFLFILALRLDFPVPVPVGTRLLSEVNMTKANEVLNFM